MQTKPSYKLNSLLNLPKRLPSQYTEQDYGRNLQTYQKYGGGSSVTDERYDGVWQKIKKAITDHVTKRRNPNDQKRAVLLGGAPGSGKSTQRLNGFDGQIPSRREAAHIDVDEVKQLLPEYNGYIERGSIDAAGATHEESRNLASSVINSAIRQEQDIVYDTSGQFRNSGELKRLKDAGYKLEAHYFVGDHQVFLERIRARAAKEGRYVPESYVHIIQDNLYGVMAQEMSTFDDFSLWGNDTEGGPVLLARKAMKPDGTWTLELFDQRATGFISVTNMDTTQRFGETP